MSKVKAQNKKMPETLTHNPQEHLLELHRASAAEEVFTGVYSSFAESAKRAQGTQWVDGGVESVAVNAPLEFVKSRFEAANRDRRIELLDATPLRPSEVKDKLMTDAIHAAREKYGNNQLAVAAKVERSERVVRGFIERAGDMYKSREVDGLTIKLFFDQIDAFKPALSLIGYNNLVRKSDEQALSEEAKHRYAWAVHDMLAVKPHVEEQENGGFLHVNAHLEDQSSTDERYYISPKLNGRPEEVIKIWTETLEDLGLSDKLYYKVSAGLARRYDTLIAFSSPNTAADMEKALKEFERRCPADLLSDATIPTGIDVAQGIVRAPEPLELNKLLSCRGQKTLSYNELVCATTELSLRLGSYDFIQQGKKPEEVTPRLLSEAAKPYFVQFMKLSGINPETMKAA